MSTFGATVGAGILSQGVTEILKTLSILAAKEIALAWGVNDELQDLKETLDMILDLMVDAENKQMKSKAVRRWLKKLKDIALEAEDILEEHAYESIRRQQQITRKRHGVRNFFSHNPLVFRQKIAHAIKNVNKKLNKHRVVSVSLGFETLKLDQDLDVSSKLLEHRQTESGFDESLEFMGRDEDKSKIIKMLLDDHQDENIQVIPIVGMGGVGKTTIAQLIYDDDTVKKHFDLRMWVCVSNEFNVQKLVVKIIESITDSKCDDVSNLDVLTRQLQKHLSGNKYLLVLDDVWNKIESEWGRLRNPLLRGDKGSKILTTTRSEEVASIMGGELHSYKLGILNNDESWSLFHKRVFGYSGGPMETPSLMDLGRELVGKCQGLPLALIFLISLLRNKDENEWRVINENKIWVESYGEDDILPILKLSYDHLPSHLKLCFSYFSLFPKDERFYPKTIILLWMAEGFLPQPSGGINITMEELGNQYFNSLLRNSFFQNVEKDEFDQVSDFKMHDLVHDLAIHVAGDRECLVFNSYENMESISNVRRLGLFISKEDNNFNKIMTVGLHNNPKLRTLLVNDDSIKKIEDNVFDGTKRLRVLDLSRMKEMKEISSASMSNLKHLRYLNLQYTQITNLPESVMSLYYLQTLNLSSCKNLYELPKGIEKLINLRHLMLPDRCFNLPREIGQLSCLQTLRPIYVGDKNRGGCGIEILEELNLLNGEIKITELGNVTSGVDAQRANLGRKKLNTIRMSWRSTVRVDDCGVDEAVLEALQPHPNLKKLTIIQYFGVKLPRWMGGGDPLCLPNLCNLELSGCYECEQLVGFGKLPSLKILRLVDMDGIKCLGNEFYYNNNNSGGGGGSSSSSSSSSSRNTDGVVLFPSLKVLVLFGMNCLEEWVDINNLPPTPTVANYSCFPCLRSIWIYRCPKLRITPTRFPSLKELVLEEINERVIEPIITTSHPSMVELRNISGLRLLPQSLLLDGYVASLKVSDCLDFQGFVASEEDQNEEEEEEVFTVADLSLVHLPALKFLPDIQSFTSLERLLIEDCENFKPSPEDLTCLPSSLEHLQEVEIKNVKDVQDFVYRS